MNFDDFCPLTSRTRAIDRFIGDTVIRLEQIGLLFDAEKTVVLTNHAQPPPILATDGRLQLTILEQEVAVAC